MISEVLIGAPGKNTYVNVRAVLTNLGISNRPVVPHQHHFHLYLRPQQMQAILPTPGNLVATFRDEAEETVQADPAIEDLIMLSADVIYTPTLDVPVISVTQQFAQIGAGTGRSEVKVRTLNAGCADVETADPRASWNNFSPLHVVMRHLGYRLGADGARYDIPPAVANSIQVTLSSPPSHGDLVPFTPSEYFYWKYFPKDAYKGRDSATFLVNVDGKKFSVTVHYAVQETIWDNQEPDGCRLMFPGEIKTRKFGSAAELLFGVEGSLDQWRA